MKYKRTTKLNGVLIDLEPQISGLSWNGGNSLIIVLSLFSTDGTLSKKENITLPITEDLGSRLQNLKKEFIDELLAQEIIENDRGGITTNIKEGVGSTIQRIGREIEAEVGSSLAQLTDGVRAGMAENARTIAAGINSTTTAEVDGVRDRVSSSITDVERELTEAINKVKKESGGV